MTYSGDQINNLIKNGTLAELREARTHLISDKTSIECQLTEDKHEMLEERAALIAEGSDLRSAVIRASAGGDANWRGRARQAQKVTDGYLARLNRRISDLAGTKPRVTTVFAGVGSAGAVVALQRLLDAGCSVYGIAAFGDDLVVIHTEEAAT